MSYKVFLGLRARFQKVLCEYSVREIAERTLAKNDLNDLRKMFILPDDTASILAALQLALNGLELDRFRPIVFCFRFGEKMRGGLKMTDFDRDLIEKVTVHAAVDISSIADIDIMWSMSGLQDVIGTRGTLSTCLSFSDYGNFQSNLDGRLIDVKAELRRICYYPENLKFVQLYADVPHRKPKSRFHPVSGMIAGGMCFAKPTVNAFCRDTACYLSALECNWSLMRKSTCRLEVVSQVDVASDVIHATDVIDVLQVDLLLQNKPMLVPFPKQSLACIRELGLWITATLKGLYEKFQKTGNVEATWYALQLELASEKLLWGRPLCNISNRYSVNLGPGLLAVNRSLSDDLGFLALDAWSTCLVDEDSIPLYCIWTQSETMGKCMIRAAGLHDHLQGSYPVIGRRLVYALLADLYDIGKVGTYFSFGEFVMGMKVKETRFQTVGCITAKSLCKLLEAKRRMALHMVFGCLCNLLEKAGLLLNEVLDAGLKELKLNHFPAVQTYDRHGNALLTWSFKSNFWTIVDSSGYSYEGTPVSSQIFSDLVKGELERRGLIFASKLKKITGPFPWIGCCIRKLQREKMDEESTVKTLSFISCIAFIMQGWFIDYDRLSILVSELPVSQSKLKSLEIQSKLQLANVNFKNLTVYRLHASVSHQLQKPEAGLSRLAPKQVTIETPQDEDIGRETTRKICDDIVDTIGVDIERRMPFCKPVDVTRKAWSAK